MICVVGRIEDGIDTRVKERGVKTVKIEVTNWEDNVEVEEILEVDDYYSNVLKDLSSHYPFCLLHRLRPSVLLFKIH